MKLITEIPDVPDVAEAVNELLPPEIRVWRIIRVQNSFNARTCAFLPSSGVLHYISTILRSCDSRKYTYFFPSYLLIPPKPGSGLYETLHRQVVSLSGTPPTATACPPPHIVHPFWTDSAPVSSKDDDLQRKRRWRAGTEDVQRLREIAKKFEGTHNFHNFTVGREFSDRSTQRHMKKIEVSLLLPDLQGLITRQVADPVVYGSTEWISVMFHGQSFMLHQVLGPYEQLFRHLHCLFRSCVRRATAVSSTLIALYPTAQNDFCISLMLPHMHTLTGHRRSA
jgi:tRNA pseudouridine38-40 synthase